MTQKKKRKVMVTAMVVKELVAKLSDCCYVRVQNQEYICLG
jgi:hypothetical protein